MLGERISSSQVKGSWIRRKTEVFLVSTIFSVFNLISLVSWGRIEALGIERGKGFFLGRGFSEFGVGVVSP